VGEGEAEARCASGALPGERRGEGERSFLAAGRRRGELPAQRTGRAAPTLPVQYGGGTEERSCAHLLVQYRVRSEKR